MSSKQLLSFDLLKTFASVPPDCTVLDFGAGEGVHAKALHQLGFQIHAIEASTFSLSKESYSFPFQQENLNELSYENELFDWVVAFHLLDRYELLETRSDILQEMWRIMREGAWVYVAVSQEKKNQNGHVGYSVDVLQTLFTSAGFAVAQTPKAIEEQGEALVVGIFRKVSQDTIR